jgi:hypothetical protein
MAKLTNPSTTKAKATKATKSARKAFNVDAKITLLAKENPKLKGSACFKRFAKYRSGMKVEAALTAGLRRDDLRWDVAHGFIRVG